MLRGADPVNDELEVGFDQHFERQWSVVEAVGRVFMACFVLAALCGLFGRGPLSHTTKSDPAGLLSVDYEPVSKFATTTQITLHLHPLPNEVEVPVRLSGSFGEPMNVQSVIPRPLRTVVGDDGATLVFAVDPGSHDALVRINCSPAKIGPIRLSARVDGHPPIAWMQVIVP